MRRARVMEELVQCDARVINERGLNEGGDAVFTFIAHRRQAVKCEIVTNANGYWPVVSATSCETGDPVADVPRPIESIALDRPARNQ